MDETVDDTNERLQREERRRNRLAARRRNWFGWGNLHSVSATAVKQPLTRPMVRQRLKWNVAALAPVFFAAPLLALMIILFVNLWPHTHSTVSAHAPLATAQPKSTPALAVAPASGKTILLLLGTDQRQGDKGFRTDVIVLVSIDADNGQVGAVSFPRDMWVKVPALYEMKINSIMQLGGFDAMAGMFKANFGVKPDYYVLTNFEGFSKFVDLLRGVDVQVAQPLKDACDLPMAVHGDCSVKPGTVDMDGTEALWYVRSRETSSDFDRLRRAQEVLVAIFKKIMTRNAILKIPGLQAALKGNVETNMPFTKVLPLVPVADKVFNDTSLIKKFAITEDQSTPFTSWNGEWILLPDNQAIHDVLAQAGFFK